MLFSVTCADGQLYKNNEKFKLGISGGWNVTRVHGSELIDPLPKAGFTIGMYYRHQLAPDWHSLVEARTTFRGSRFKAEVDEDYEKLDLVYLDLPLQIMYTVAKNDEAEHLIFAGPQLSALVNSRMFIHQYIRGPSSQATYLHDDIDLKVFDLAGVLGYQYNGYYMGVHAALKAGVLNINNNLNLVGVRQPTGTNGTIYNVALEVVLLF